MEAPLILALALNPEAEQFFNQLRQHYFPPERNFLAAHLTLFHHLPQEPKIIDDIKKYCAQQQSFSLQVTGVLSLGRGVAYKLESAVLQTGHKQLQQQWQSWLIPQDRQKLRPHVTVQNKVTPTQAQDLLQQLRSTFSPFEVMSVGLRLWRYLGGPWDLLQTFPFTNVAKDQIVFLHC
jgi:2'-5' RNA ligase